MTFPGKIYWCATPYLKSQHRGVIMFLSKFRSDIQNSVKNSKPFYDINKMQIEFRRCMLFYSNFRDWGLGYSLIVIN